MGSILTRVEKSRHHETPVWLVMLGIDARGLSSYLYGLKLGEVVSTIPTTDIGAEAVKGSGVEIRAWEVGGGRGIMRPLWRWQFAKADGLIFVLDSGDPERIVDAQRELESTLGDAVLKGVPVLILAKKSDLSNHMSLQEIKDSMQLNSYRDRPLHITETSALTEDGIFFREAKPDGKPRQFTEDNTGDGLYDGLEWIAAAISRRKTGEEITGAIKSGKDAICYNYGTAIMKKLKKYWVPSSNKSTNPE